MPSKFHQLSKWAPLKYTENLETKPADERQPQDLGPAASKVISKCNGHSL